MVMAIHVSVWCGVGSRWFLGLYDADEGMLSAEGPRGKAVRS